MKRERVVIVFAVCFMLFVLSSWAFAQTTVPEQPKAPAGDQNWTVYLESENRKYYFNPASEERFDEAKVRVWEKIAAKNKDGESDIVKSLIEFNCASSKYRIVASREFDVSGQEKPEVRLENEPWQYFNLETVLGALYDNVCYKHGTKIQKLKSIPSLVAPAKDTEKP
ncbi:MAG: hypothetical protein H6Q52_2389 [Deltaproteobacteria bacterium]|nr:hypothetical protein [Deltaproteobacteria bacterium]